MTNKIPDGKIVKILNEDTQFKGHWFDKNHFFGITLFFILFNIIMHAIGGNEWAATTFPATSGDWYSFSIDLLVRSFFNSFAHLDWQHVLLNMICFLVVGAYLERKMGSAKLFLLVLALAFLTSATTTGNSLTVNWAGFSAVNFALYSFVVVDYVSMFVKKQQDKTKIITGAVVLFLIYIATSFQVDATTFAFAGWPHDLIHNRGHVSGALVGLVIALIVQVSRIGFTKEHNSPPKIDTKK